MKPIARRGAVQLRTLASERESVRGNQMMIDKVFEFGAQGKYGTNHVPSPEQQAEKCAAAEAKRARKNAKRVKL